jgi:hypothetical protein
MVFAHIDSRCCNSILAKRMPGKRKRSDAPEDLGDESSGPWAPVAEEKSQLVLLTLNPKDAPAIKDAEAVQKEEEKAESNQIAAAPIAIAASKQESEEDEVEERPQDPTLHIVEPDEEAEMWEKVNERKINATLPPRPPRGSIPAAVRKTKACSCL